MKGYDMASSANLGQHLETYVSDLVKTGRYNSRSGFCARVCGWSRSGRSGLRRSTPQLRAALKMPTPVAPGHSPRSGTG